MTRIRAQTGSLVAFQPSHRKHRWSTQAEAPSTSKRNAAIDAQATAPSSYLWPEKSRQVAVGKWRTVLAAGEINEKDSLRRGGTGCTVPSREGPGRSCRAAVRRHERAPQTRGHERLLSLQ